MVTVYGMKGNRFWDDRLPFMGTLVAVYGKSGYQSWDMGYRLWEVQFAAPVDNFSFLAM